MMGKVPRFLRAPQRQPLQHVLSYADGALLPQEVPGTVSGTPPLLTALAHS